MRQENRTLIAAFVILACTWSLVLATRTTTRCEDYEEKLRAAEQTEACIQFVREKKETMGVPINTASDINRTGVIGQDYSVITTTLGELEAKRTSTNPNMAAVVVDMFHDLGLRAGDKVAINCSGSFPALNIAVMCAVDTLGLDPILITSFGASTHGANDPEMTYLDMEHFLYEQGLLKHKSDYFSIGGMEDVGKEMEDETVRAIVERLKGYGYSFFYDEDLLHNVRARYKIYRDYGAIRCFVNVGGNDASFGDSSVMVHADGGILTELSERDGSTGLVQLFLKAGTPVIHLLNIKNIAIEYGLPVDPSPVPPVGDGDVYYTYHDNKILAATGAALAVWVLWAGRRKKRTYGSFQKGF